MDGQLNYHHLLYFWTVLKEGGVSAASKKLQVAQPTVSGQLRALAQSLGGKLLERRGRRLVPTELGALVFRYAEEICSIGSELSDALRGRPTARPQRLTVGIADHMPKLVAWRSWSRRCAVDAPCTSFATRTNRSVSWPIWPCT